jgi:formate dehydrogenase maturation protein FdhE
MESRKARNRGFRKETEQMNKNAYIQGKGLFCPFCLSIPVEGSAIEIQAGTASQEMRCPECGKAWHDIYRLVDMVPFETKAIAMEGL